ncbi:dienelactone hydrolase family protein [Demequina sp. NBRC 110057]|uniref:dienelactone hydrolase family protein n=1 Tax=Demequina sp. NBRC 110057 TaxID=1570346 RepID=UPI000A03C7A0|nr:dienelactone hydrolase family protein [Demequina sp. NBRC 110057]
MGALVERDIDYSHEGTAMSGFLAAPAGATDAPALLLIHDAFGLTPAVQDEARRLADSHGLAVLAADVWGGRTQPRSEDEIGPLIGAAVADRTHWMGRIRAAQAALTAQPEADATHVAAIGWCVGGSGVLEHLRTGGDLVGAIAIHAGLDLLAEGWEDYASSAKVLVATGADDPMATAAQRDALTTALSAAGLYWELDLYADTVHAFTSPGAAHSPHPDVIAYHPVSAARARAAADRFLTELVATP